MDIKCPKCGEPWEIDTLHEEIEARYPNKPWASKGKYDDKMYAQYFDAMRKEFRQEGCEAFREIGGGHNIATLGQRSNALYGELLDLAGEDIDFAASMIEDAERLGL